MEKPIVLSGMRPTGRLHLGHYAGALKNWYALQQSDKYNMFVFMADTQALTDNAKNPKKIQDNVLEVALDYLSCGLDPKKITIFVQSQIPELFELTGYFMNLVTVSRLQRNPTVKEEIKQRGFNTAIPVGFFNYPISQAADITLFGGELVPCGDDQAPLIEQTREIVRSFNECYGELFVEPKALLPENDICKRLPGLDGQAKMSKSLGNCIYLADDSETVKKKVMSMYTDPNHIKVEDPGKIEGNVVFTYLDAFGTDTQKIAEMKEHYQKGGLGDVVVKKYLISVLEEMLDPIRQKRKSYEKDIKKVYDILDEGSKKARKIAQENIAKVRCAIGIDYFNDKELIKKQEDFYKKNM